MRIILFLTCLLGCTVCVAQILPINFICTEAKYATFSPERGRYVPKVDMKKLSISISITKSVVVIKNFAPATFRIIHQTKEKNKKGYNYGFLLEDNKHAQCSLTVTTRYNRGQKQITATLLSDKTSEGFYHQSVEYLSR